MNKNHIEHDGIVTGCDENSVTVSITTVSACAGCHAKSACNMSDKKDKIINIKGRYNVSVGDKVIVLMHRALGYPAMLLGYVFPMILVVLTLIISLSLSISEEISGIMSLIILIPYYILLRFFKTRIDKKFTFTLKL